jgi:very-short-patch-repair endonuclease
MHHDKRERARELRLDAPHAERKVWRALRNRGLDGFRFKRQVPIGPWFADFCCHEARLIVEQDGYHHAETKARDERRTAWLEREGYRVIRFWNGDVFTSFDAVLRDCKGGAGETSAIGRARALTRMRLTPHSTSPREGRGER